MSCQWADLAWPIERERGGQEVSWKGTTWYLELYNLVAHNTPITNGLVGVGLNALMRSGCSSQVSEMLALGCLAEIRVLLVLLGV